MEGNGFISAVFKPAKRHTLFDTAIAASNSIKALMSLDRESSEGLDFDRKIFTHVFQNDPNSPLIYWLENNQYVILYPANSTPYSHKFEKKCKFIEVLSGVIYDVNSDLKLFKGDTLKIYPQDNYMPYTLEKPAYLRVCVGNCSSLLDQICK
jgi:hypothetical protein